MAEPVFAGAPAAVIGKDFVSPHTIELLTKKKGGGKLDLIDSNGNVKLKVKDRFFSNRLNLVDANGEKLITLKPKSFSLHSKWEVFRGGSTNSQDLIFTVQRSKVFQWKTKLHVMLRENEGPDGTHDYRLEETKSNKSCVIYVGDSNNMVAQMHKKKSKNWFGSNNHFILTVYPNIDYAFIIAIIAILDAINTPSGGGATGGGGGGAGGGGGGCGGGG